MTGAAQRAQIVQWKRSLFDLGLTPGSDTGVVGQHRRTGRGRVPDDVDQPRQHGAGVVLTREWPFRLAFY